MRFTQHTAMRAAEQIAAGTPLAEIDETELSSLEAMIRAEIQDRNLRNPDQFNIWAAVGDALQEQF